MIAKLRYPTRETGSFALLVRPRPVLHLHEALYGVRVLLPLKLIL